MGRDKVTTSTALGGRLFSVLRGYHLSWFSQRHYRERRTRRILNRNLLESSLMAEMWLCHPHSQRANQTY